MYSVQLWDAAAFMLRPMVLNFELSPNSIEFYNCVERKCSQNWILWERHAQLNEEYTFD